MCQNHKLVNMGFTNEKFPEGTHMCLIYNKEEERQKIISKYIKGGLSSGQMVAYFAEDISKKETNKWLSEMGIHLSDAKSTKGFSLQSTFETYFPRGKFDVDSMLENLKNFYLTSKEESYPAVRVTGEMTWALNEVPGSEDLMEYESKVNEVLKKYPVTAVCQYDANKFDGATILECLKVHPYMIVHGQIIQNPYYLNPEEYLNQIDK